MEVESVKIEDKPRVRQNRRNNESKSPSMPDLLQSKKLAVEKETSPVDNPEMSKRDKKIRLPKLITIKQIDARLAPNRRVPQSMRASPIAVK